MSNPTAHEEETTARRAQSIAVYVCTYRRNEPLTTLLTSLVAAAAKVQPECPVAVVVVDDNPDGRAEAVVDSFPHEFELGLHYTHTGSQNISTARNRGIETGMELAEWVAMTDDDQTVSADWLAELVATQRSYDADAVTGPVFIQFADDSPKWLQEQPFGEFFEAQPRVDGEQVDTCSTGNSMINSQWLRDHPNIRFRNDLGVLGGEDMVFYRGAMAEGLQAFYSLKAEAYQLQPEERARFSGQLRSAYWLGNTTFLTNLESGAANRPRLAVRALKKLAEAGALPIRRAIKGESPQLRFATAKAALAYGMLVGVVGVKVKHT